MYAINSLIDEEKLNSRKNWYEEIKSIAYNNLGSWYLNGQLQGKQTTYDISEHIIEFLIQPKLNRISIYQREKLITTISFNYEGNFRVFVQTSSLNSQFAFIEPNLQNLINYIDE